MKLKYLLFFLVAVNLTLAQSETDTIKKPGWYPAGVAGLNLSQVAFSNWSQGGDNSLAWTLFSKVNYDYFSPDWIFKNELKLAYGRTKLGSADYRTNDNEIYLESVLSHFIGWAVDPYISNTVRSSLSKGFDYKTTGFPQIADFFDPGYVTQSIGFTYNKIEGFNTRIGVGFQETFTSKFNNYSDDAKTKDKVEKFKFETGIESVTEGKYEIEENLLADTKLRLFSRFEDLSVWDVRWDNTITAQVNKYVNVNLNVLIVYEVSQSLKTQLKEGLQLGLVYNLF
ncbi:MAG: DUF3078 domain-containing protein [Ignavibacteriaceae bacterium]|nr:DUF3078 domain-containing protein [Ignavibacteriaceae bacterium]